MKKIIILIALLVLVVIFGGVSGQPAKASLLGPAAGPEDPIPEKEQSGMYDAWHQPVPAQIPSPQLLVQSDRFGYR
jgi:hypothetical protein